MKAFSLRNFSALVAGLVLLSTTLAASAATIVSMKTNKGEIVMELYPEKAPKTVANFLQYVKSGQYAGTIFHRVIPGFMIQGGGFDKTMTQKATKAPVKNEASSGGLLNEPYSLAMARTGDPHSATSQFFINVANNAMLNFPGSDGWGYCVFGKVIKGKDVVDKITQVKVTTKEPYENVPVDPVIIKSITLAK